MGRKWHGREASGATCPPPQPSIGHPVRSMQIQGDFHVRKKWGGRFTRFAPTFYRNRNYGGRSLVLRLRKKEFVEVVKVGIVLMASYYGRSSVKMRGPWDLSVLAWAFGAWHFLYLFFLYFLIVNLGPFPKNSGPNWVSFQFLTGGWLTQVLDFPPPPNLETLAKPVWGGESKKKR